MTPVRLLLLAAVALGLGLGLGSGCVGYQAGSVMHPQIHAAAVSVPRNDTVEPDLGPQLRQALIATLMNDGSLTVTEADRADVTVETRVRGCTFRRIAASKVSDSRQEGRSTYETSIYEARVTVEYELRMPGLRRPVLERQTVFGTAEFTTLPDHVTARREGLRRALQDAAQQIAAGITEGW